MQNAEHAVTIRAMPALQHFFDAERLRRGWSIREVAARSQMSASKAYAIVNGDDNVEFETFENIASAFGMSPAELAIAIGKGSAEHDPAEAHAIALFRQVPADKRPAATDMLRGLAVQPVRPQANRRKGGLAQLDRNGEMPSQSSVDYIYQTDRRWSVWSVLTAPLPLLIPFLGGQLRQCAV